MVKNEEKKEEKVKISEEVKQIIKDGMPERVPKSETKWIEEQADGEQQKKEWKQRESAKPVIDLDKGTVKNVDLRQKKEEVNPMNKLNHPLQAYSYSMQEPEPIEVMMWQLLEKIDLLCKVQKIYTSSIYFELGKIYSEFMTKLRTFVENKGKDVALDKILLTITGPPISGKTYILEEIKNFLKVNGFDVQTVAGKSYETEHCLKITPSENVRK